MTNEEKLRILVSDAKLSPEQFREELKKRKHIVCETDEDLQKAREESIVDITGIVDDIDEFLRDLGAMTLDEFLDKAHKDVGMK